MRPNWLIEWSTVIKLRLDPEIAAEYDQRIERAWGQDHDDTAAQALIQRAILLGSAPTPPTITVTRAEGAILRLIDALRRKDSEQDGNWGFPSFYEELTQIENELRDRP